MKDLSFLKNNVFAHRGLHNDVYPENSIGAFKHAIEKNMPIELDVHLLKDNTIVVFHDDDLNRMAGIDKKLKDVTYNDIKDIRLKDTEYKIPLFSEVLELVNGKVPIIVELKYDRKFGLLEEEVFKYLDNYKGVFCVKSFHPLIVRYIKKKRPNYIRGLLIGISNKKYENILTHSIFNILFCKPDFISCYKKLYTNKNIIKYKKNNPALVWVVRTNEEINKYKVLFDSILYEEKE